MCLSVDDWIKIWHIEQWNTIWLYERMKSYRLNSEGIILSEKSDRERQILYNFTYMWNIKNKINRQTKQKQTHRENKLRVARWEGLMRMGEMGEGSKKYKLVVTK